MLLSSTSGQALRALLFLAAQEDDTPVLGREIARVEGIPGPSLAKILHALNAHGLVRSTRGPGGGYALSRAPEAIMVGEVVAAIEGPRDFSKTCILGLDACSDENPCALHGQWRRFREALEKQLWKLSLAEAARTLQEKRAGTAAGV